jgi:hypothetical protein
MIARVAVWECVACGQLASTVYVLEADQSDPKAADEVMSTYHRIAIWGGPVSVTIGLDPSQRASVLAAVNANDASALFELDREFAPFWCPECEATYCAQHYVHWDVYDDGFFDCIRGTCPNGHERMLLD